MPQSAPNGALRRVPATSAATVRFLKRRARLGVHRSANSILPALKITICSVGAFYFASTVLGHHGPLFAATSAIIALGFSKDPRLRRVLEVALGCTIGVALGDTLLHWLGVGVWQAGLVVFVSILLARFLDTGVIFTTQLALQSLLVMLLPLPAGGPFTRSIDAMVGGCFALLATFLFPRDPRRGPGGELRGIIGELAVVLRECSSALSYNDSTTAWHALVRARGQQSRIDAMRSGLQGAVEVARLSPLQRRHLEEVESYSAVMEHADYAMRSARTLARRLISVINNSALTEVGAAHMADVLTETALALDELAVCLANDSTSSTSSLMRHVRDSLAEVAMRLHPEKLEIDKMEGQTLVLLFRTLMVDLLRIAGMSAGDAAASLPKL